MKIPEINRVLEKFNEDLEYLIFVGLPTGVLCIAFSDYLDFTFLSKAHLTEFP
jgi:hypothetical protein